MPKIKAEDSQSAIEPGIYECECTRTWAETLENPQYGNGDVIKIKLELDVADDDGETVELEAMANRKLTPMSKLWSWFEAFNVPVSVGDELDTDQMVGKRCQVEVGERKTERGTWATVDRLFKLPTRAAPRQRPARAIDQLGKYAGPEGEINARAFADELGRLGLTMDELALVAPPGSRGTRPDVYAWLRSNPESTIDDLLALAAVRAFGAAPATEFTIEPA